MAKKLKHFIVSVEVLKLYEVDIDSASEESAEKAVLKAIKNNAVKPTDENVDVTDIYEMPVDEDD